MSGARWLSLLLLAVSLPLGEVSVMADDQVELHRRDRLLPRRACERRADLLVKRTLIAMLGPVAEQTDQFGLLHPVAVQMIAQGHAERLGAGLYDLAAQSIGSRAGLDPLVGIQHQHVATARLVEPSIASDPEKCQGTRGECYRERGTRTRTTAQPDHGPDCGSQQDPAEP